MTTSSALHPFDEAVTLEETASDSYNGYIPQTYGNMVGPFGGAIAAVMLNSMLQHKERKGEPISITINYAGPITDEPFTVTTRLVRTNRTNQHWVSELSQGDKIAVTSSAVLASRRETWTTTELTPPEAPGPETLETFSFPAFPVWVKQYDIRIAGDGSFISGGPQDHSESILWVRDKQERSLDFLSLLAMSDAFFPRIFLRRKTIVPAGTVSLTTHFHTAEQALADHGSDYLLCTARGQVFYNGYSDQVASLWSPKSGLLATSSQMVYFKE